MNMRGVVALVIEPKTWTIVDANVEACLFYGFTSAGIRGKSILHLNKEPAASIRGKINHVLKYRHGEFNAKHRTIHGTTNVLIHAWASPTLIYTLIRDLDQENRIDETVQYYEMSRGG